MDLINPLVQAYAEKFTSAEDEALQKIARTTLESHAQPHMLSGHLQGTFLRMISEIMQPQYILEVGTFTGYSAICLSAGLAAGGELHTIELRPQDAELAKGNFNVANVHEKIILHVGNALEIIPGLDKQWDLVFLDADKSGYIHYYQMILPKLRKGGVILADNVLFHGKVLEEEVHGKSARAIQAFNEYVLKDESVEKVLLTIRDGLLMIIKK